MTEFLADVTSRIAREPGHVVRTVARLNVDAPGYMVAVSRFRSASWLTGFQAGAVISLIDSRGFVIAASRSQHGWAHGLWNGKSDNAVRWSFQFDPELAARASNIAVLHHLDGSYSGELVELLERNGDAIATVFDAVASSGGGGLGIAV